VKHNRNITCSPSKEQDRRLTDIGCYDLQPTETVHRNNWFNVLNRGGYYTVEYHLPQVVILPVVEQQSIVMVRVKRPVLGDIPLELPAGCAEEGELPIEGAVRELVEETGIEIHEVNRLIPLPPVSMSPNRTPKLANAFQIELTRREFDTRHPHDNEITSVECVSLKEVATMMTNGEIYVAGAMAVIGMYFSQKMLSD